MRLTDEQLAVWQHNANALAEELTRLYAIDRAAREYVEAIGRAAQNYNAGGMGYVADQARCEARLCVLEAALRGCADAT